MVPTPSPSGTETTLTSISCVTPSFCEAVGVNYPPGGGTVPIVEAWDGSAWSIASIPSTGNNTSLHGVNCYRDSTCMAVGTSGSSSLVLGLSGGTWSTVNPPAVNFIAEVSCVANWACVVASPVSGSSGAATSFFEEAFPTTTVVLPANNTTLSGSEYLDATASSGVTGVTYELSGNGLSDDVVATGTPTLYGWLAGWNTTTVPNGTYTLHSVASYSGGVSGTSPPVAVTIDNPPPTTTVVLPANNTTLSGSEYLDATASSGVTGVTYELSGNGLSDDVVATGTPTLYGWLAGWNTTTVPNGTYTLHSVASYSGGVSGTSPPVTVTISN